MAKVHLFLRWLTTVWKEYDNRSIGIKYYLKGPIFLIVSNVKHYFSIWPRSRMIYWLSVSFQEARQMSRPLQCWFIRSQSIAFIPIIFKCFKILKKLVNTIINTFPFGTSCNNTISAGIKIDCVYCICNIRLRLFSGSIATLSKEAY